MAILTMHKSSWALVRSVTQQTCPQPTKPLGNLGGNITETHGGVLQGRGELFRTVAGCVCWVGRCRVKCSCLISISQQLRVSDILYNCSSGLVRELTQAPPICRLAEEKIPKFKFISQTISTLHCSLRHFNPALYLYLFVFILFYFFVFIHVGLAQPLIHVSL